MVSVFEAVLLGVVQGVTEWLPVSSKGNVAVLAQFLGLPVRAAFSYAIILHIGTLLAAAFYFRKDFLNIFSQKEKQKKEFVFFVLFGTAITAIPSYLVLRAILEATAIQFGWIVVYPQTIFLAAVGFFLFVTGALQLAKKNQKEAALSKKNAFVVGLSQGLTVLPGMSRSGTTSSVMLFQGFSPLPLPITFFFYFESFF